MALPDGNLSWKAVEHAGRLAPVPGQLQPVDLVPLEATEDVAEAVGQGHCCLDPSALDEVDDEVAQPGGLPEVVEERAQGILLAPRQGQPQHQLQPRFGHLVTHCAERRNIPVGFGALV
ncbi:unnamed protein product [Ixodes pacificus]